MDREASSKKVQKARTSDHHAVGQGEPSGAETRMNAPVSVRRVTRYVIGAVVAIRSANASLHARAELQAHHVARDERAVERRIGRGEERGLGRRELGGELASSPPARCLPRIPGLSH